MVHICFLCLVFLMLSRLFIAVLWSPAGKGLTSCLLLVMFIVCFCYFPLWYPGSGVVLDLPSFLLLFHLRAICFILQNISHFPGLVTTVFRNHSLGIFNS